MTDLLQSGDAVAEGRQLVNVGKMLQLGISIATCPDVALRRDAQRGVAVRPSFRPTPVRLRPAPLCRVVRKKPE